MPKTSLTFGGAPITALWAWVVTDQDGKEAICRSPWSETAVLIGPDEDRIATASNGEWCRSYYEAYGMTVELRRFEIAAAFEAGRFERG